MTQAESPLELSSGFAQGFGKIEYVRETNPIFDAIYDDVATNIGLVNEVPRKLR